MKTRKKLFLICAIVIFGFYVSVTSLGPGSVFALFSPSSILYFPSILMQLVANEGNGIICVDACGPCSAWGHQYILIDGQCVLPSVESCKLLDQPGEWAFDEWTCQPVCKEPYTDVCKQEMTMEKTRELVIKNCQLGRESDLPSPNILYGNSTHHFDRNTCEWYESD